MDALDRVAKAADRVGRLEPRLVDARAELHAAIRDARAQGASIVVLSKVSGLSRQRIYDLVK